MAKFFLFEYTVELFYRHIFTRPKETYGKPTQLGITFASGYLAGIVCAVVSHPADSVVSLMGKPANKGKPLAQIASETGIVTLATKGLGARVVMIGTLTGFQWWIYDTCKTVMGLGTTWVSSPFGPLTVTVWPSTLTSTPDGTVIGALPIRDILRPPYQT